MMGPALTRREFVAGCTGLAVSTLSGYEVLTKSRAISVILVWLDGGPSQRETFDPRPDAGSDWRGPFHAIPTSVTGHQICELMPRMARLMNRVTLIRTLSHRERAHDRACRLALTGGLSGEIRPSIGSIAAHFLGDASQRPDYVALPDSKFASGYVRAGNLTSNCNPCTFENLWCDIPGSVGINPNPDWDREGLERFGDTRFGRRCILARRYLDRGVPFVAINFKGWDHHSGLADKCRRMVPQLDHGLSGLLGYLQETGRLEETLVVCIGEFGRSPHVNYLGGRDHWPDTGCALVAGAGVPGGQIIGEADALGEPVDRVISPQDLYVSILAKLGITPGKLQSRGLYPPDARYIPELG